MKKTILSGILLAAVLLFTGCGGALVNNVDNSGYIDGNKHSMHAIETAIKKGAIKRGWSVKKVANAELEAKNNIRGKHLVVVSIPYNRNGYRIDYKDSQNMKYDASANTIHKNYNKWVSNLERDINYELSQIGIVGNTTNSTSARVVTPIQPKSSAPSTNYRKGNSDSISGQTIYIKNIIPYANGNRIAQNIKAECTIDQQLAEFIKKSAMDQGLKVEYKNNAGSSDLQLIVEITDAVSQGGAFRGHNKFVTISGNLVKGNKSYGSFKAARVSGGGFWGAYKGSCAVLGRTVETLGKDVATWLYSPIDGARLRNTGLIR